MKKAISVKQPWAYLLCAGIKDVENRTWPTKYRGRVYIHASADRKLNLTILTKEQYRRVCDVFDWNSETVKPVDRWNRSAIIGHVDIVDCVINHPSVWAETTIYPAVTNARTLTNIKPIYNWVLANPVLFDEPILNVKGKLSFWNCSEYLVSTNNIQEMKQKFLILVYKSLKSQFEGIRKSSWIWVDFFENEESGFDHFKNNLELDKDFEYLNDESNYDGEDLNDLAFDVACEIGEKIAGNNFLHECQQCMLESIR